MALPETWQAPAADDIDPDSLEYLFGQKMGRADVPWVKIVREPEPIARISPEMIRLQAKLEMMVTQLEVYADKLTTAHHDLGFARAKLAEKDKQLALMDHYRVRAARAIASDVELEQLRARITELERQLSDEMHFRYQQPTFVLKITEQGDNRPEMAPQAPLPRQERQPVHQLPAARQRQPEPSNHNAYRERALEKHVVSDEGIRISLMPIIYLLVLMNAALILLTVLI